MKYCIQCTDQTSGKVGTFGYDEEARRTNPKGGFVAVTPVFDGCMELFVWARENSVILDHSPT